MEAGVVVLRAHAVSRHDVTRLAREAEELGYHSLWTNEHIAIPSQIESRYPYTPDGKPTFKIDTAWHEAMVALAFVAAVTERIRLGTAVVPLFNRDPLSLAKQAGSVDELSGGRLELGLGAGWMQEEAVLLGHPHDHRGARLDECIDILRKAWGERSFEHHGRFWDYPWAVGVHPQPPQGRNLPIWIGGESERALRTTAERAIGNLLWLAPPDKVANLRRRLDALRPGLKLAVSMRVEEDMEEKAAAIREAGADELLLMNYVDTDNAVANLRRFAKLGIAS